MALPRWVKVVGVLGVVAVILFVMLPSLQAKETGQQTDIFVGTEGGEEQVIYDENAGFWPATIVKLGGVTITYVRWVTTFIAASEDYSKYVIATGSKVEAELSKYVSSTPPTFDLCGVLASESITTPALGKEFDVGTTYNVAQGFMGKAETETLKILAASIISLAKSGCGTDEGTFILKYTIIMNIRAVGIGTAPTATIQGVYSTALSLTTGSITGSESTTRSSG